MTLNIITSLTVQVKLEELSEWINCRMKFDKRKKNLLPDFFFIYGEKKKACKSEKQALARLFYFRKGCEHSGKKKDKETPV